MFNCLQILLSFLNNFQKLQLFCNQNKKFYKLTKFRQITKGLIAFCLFLHHLAWNEQKAIHSICNVLGNNAGNNKHSGKKTTITDL